MRLSWRKCSRECEVVPGGGGPRPSGMLSIHPPPHNFGQLVTVLTTLFYVGFPGNSPLKTSSLYVVSFSDAHNGDDVPSASGYERMIDIPGGLVGLKLL